MQALHMEKPGSTAMLDGFSTARLFIMVFVRKKEGCYWLTGQ